MENAYALEIRDLCYTYKGGHTALEHIDLKIEKGEFVAIIGQNGAGNSTLLKNITGLLRPTTGSVWVNGKDIADWAVSEISQSVGFVLQNPDRQLFAATVREEIAFSLENLGLDKEEIENRSASALASVGLLDAVEQFPLALSRGDRAKVVIACVLAMNPDILLLDEPTGGQDYRGCYQVMDIAKELHRLGKTVVVVTHHMALVAEYTNRAIVMSRANILLDDETRSVFSQPELLATTHIKPPQITELASTLAPHFGIDKTICSVNEMADCLAPLA